MQSFLEIFWAVVVTLTGAVLFGAAMAAGVAVLCGGAVAGCLYACSRRRGRKGGRGGGRR
ncbi:hypothetical protein AEB_P1749 [Altererythrobacter sp. B11]|uniref:hypothetical protein n=1 Tax=Altererythrobacter sp. B11 TaxID=2060312 RepID=UPI000DC6E0AE|nr:hypothetical protein [Altererythrobacter sp. B11]BBC72617.1 hypothetical protein AEB_P1749 [Altererythrobacter sp. B11]